MQSEREIAPQTLYVSDLDFTLLGSDAQLSDRTVDVINHVLAAGHQFTYATARSYSSAMRVTRELQITLPVLTYGGALTCDPNTNAHIDVRAMTDTVIEAICAITAEHPTVEPLLYAILDGRDRVLWRDNHSTEHTRTFVADRAGNPRLLPVADWSGLPPGGVFYATLIGDRRDITAIERELAPHLESCFTTIGPDGYRPEQTCWRSTPSTPPKPPQSPDFNLVSAATGLSPLATTSTTSQCSHSLTTAARLRTRYRN